jgi:2-oxoglutarate dehydrogenase complex dehydrogenase (E1) component-like enzyme
MCVFNSPVAELDHSRYGLSLTDRVNTTGITYGLAQECQLSDVQDFLEAVYSGPISAEFTHLQVLNYSYNFIQKP